MYIPERLRTASKPSRTVIERASYAKGDPSAGDTQPPRVPRNTLKGARSSSGPLRHSVLNRISFYRVRSAMWAFSRPVDACAARKGTCAGPPTHQGGLQVVCGPHRET